MGKKDIEQRIILLLNKYYDEGIIVQAKKIIEFYEWLEKEAE